MRYKTRKVPEAEYDALLQKVLAAHPKSENGGYAGIQIVGVDSDFLPTQRMDEVRFLACENYYGYSLIQVDGVGDMITLEKAV